MSQKKKSKYMHDDEQDDSRVSVTKIGDLKSFLFLLNFARPYRSALIFAVGLIATSSILATISARITGALVEDGLMKQNWNQSIAYALMIVLASILTILSLWWGRRILSEKSSRVILDIRSKLFEHLQDLPLRYYDRQPQGRIVTRLTHDVEGLEEFFTSSMGRLLHACVLAVVIACAMLLTHFKIGVYLIISILPAVFFVMITKGRIRFANRRMSRMSSRLNSNLSEYLDAIFVIRVLGLEEWSAKQYEQTGEEYLSSMLASNRLYALVMPTNLFLCSLPLLVMIGFGGPMVISSALSVGVFVAFVRYCEQFFHPLFTLVREMHVIQAAFTSAERLVAFLKEETEDRVLGSNGVLGEDNSFELKGHIAFGNVSMFYDESQNWVLRDISFSVESGDRIGLVGSTGCGKTTTVSLLSRLYEYQKGDIFIDHRSIRDYDRDFLRRSIGFVSQDVIIHKGTVRENLDAKGVCSDEQILSACHETGLDRVMIENGVTLDSMLYEGGSNLSVGERQLIAITRILLQNPKILIMDEATSNVDPKYEKLIHEAVDKTMRGRTCLIIAHRLETLASCDRILVFDDGRVVEEGSQQSLLENGTIFRRLYDQAFKSVQRDFSCEEIARS